MTFLPEQLTPVSADNYASQIYLCHGQCIFSLRSSWALNNWAPRVLRVFRKGTGLNGLKYNTATFEIDGAQRCI